MSVTNDLLEGLIKPALDFLLTVIFYSFGKAALMILAILKNQPSGFFTFDVWYFLGLFIPVSIVLEIFVDIHSGYHKPINATFRILGVVVGTIVFWNFFGVAYAMLAGSRTDILISELISIVALCFGIFLRMSIEKRKNRQNDDYRYDY